MRNLALLLVVATGCAGQAGSKSEPQPGQAKSWAGQMTVNGQVLEAKGTTLRIRPRGGRDLTLDLTDSTAISVDGQQGSVAANVQPGSDARASYRMVDGRATALAVDVRSNSSQRDPGQQDTQPAKDTSPK